MSILDTDTSQRLGTARWRVMFAGLAAVGAVVALVILAGRLIIPDAPGIVFLFILVGLPGVLFWLFVGVRAYQAGQESTSSATRVWFVGVAALLLVVGVGFAFVISAALLPLAAEGAAFWALSWIASAFLIGIWAYLGGLLSRSLREGTQKRLGGATTMFLMLGLVLPLPGWIASYALAAPNSEGPELQWLQTIRLGALAAGILTGVLTFLQRARQPTIIFVYQLDEGVDVWRPVDAKIVAPDWYRILSENENRDDEHWQFGGGDVVRCERRRLSDGECLVAVARKNEHS